MQVTGLVSYLSCFFTHTFAGNVLMFPSGDWYGYVTPSRVKDILEHHSKLRKENYLLQRYQSVGDIIKDMWRGRAALSKEQLARLSNF